MPFDRNHRMVASARAQGRWAPGSRRRRRTWPALLCLLGLVGSGLAPAVAGAATSLPSWPIPSIVKPWWSYLPGMGGGTTGGGTTGGGGTTTPPPPTTTPPPSSGGTQVSGHAFSGTFTNSAGSLDYVGYVPSSYKSGNAVPLVVALHGCTQTADGFRQLTRWDTLAEAKGFIVVFPQQSQSGNSQKCWNFFQQAHMQRGSGEPAVIAGITQLMQQRYSVDSHRIFVNGLSAGGAMSSVMAATYPDIYAAAGIGSGCEYAATAACAGYKSADPVQAGRQAAQAMGKYERPMPVILFEGDQDKTVPPINAQQLVQQWQVTDDIADDGGANGSIPVQPDKVTQGSVPGGHSYTVTTYGDAAHKELIESWLVAGMGHAWSGGCSCQQYADPAGPDETGAMYAFFMAHPMP